MLRRVVGFSGFGHMAKAIAFGGQDFLRQAGKIPIFNRTPLQEVPDGFEVMSSNVELAKASNIFIIGTKPGQVLDVCDEISEVVKKRNITVVSVAAGVPTDAIAKALEYKEARIVRAMPNTPAMVQCGMTVLFATPSVPLKEYLAIQKIFSSVGAVETIDDENLMSAVTGVSGSGPAYVFFLIEAMTEAGVQQGLPQPLARKLATQTVYGAGAYAAQSDEQPSTLRGQVTSPGGTTAQGIGYLEKGGLVPLVSGAVDAAAARSNEIEDEVRKSRVKKPEAPLIAPKGGLSTFGTNHAENLSMSCGGYMDASVVADVQALDVESSGEFSAS